jgi:hypothetical protein
VTYADFVQTVNDPRLGPVFNKPDTKGVFDAPEVAEVAARNASRYFEQHRKEFPGVTKVEAVIDFQTYVLLGNRPLYQIKWTARTAWTVGKPIGFSQIAVTDGDPVDAISAEQMKALKAQMPIQQLFP